MCARKCRFLVLNSYPEPPPPLSEILYRPLPDITGPVYLYETGGLFAMKYFPRYIHRLGRALLKHLWSLDCVLGSK